jgi:hypothetical protein
MPLTQKQTGVTFNDNIIDKKSTPTELALASTRTTLASLHHSQHKTINNYIEKIVSHVHVMYKYTQSTKIIDEEEFIPRSLRFKFEFSTTNDNKDTDVFKELQQQAKTAITTCQETLKSLIKNVKALEVTTNITSLFNTIYKACAFHIKMEYMQFKQDMNNLYRVMLRNININKLSELKKTLIDTITDDTLFQGCCISKPDNYQYIDNDELSEIDIKIQQNINTLFIEPWCVYITATEKRNDELELEKFAKLQAAEKKAEEVLTIIDNDTLYDRITLDKIINDTVNKKLTMHINKNKQLTEKNKKKNGKRKQDDDNNQPKPKKQRQNNHNNGYTSDNDSVKSSDNNRNNNIKRNNKQHYPNNNNNNDNNINIKNNNGNNNGKNIHNKDTKHYDNNLQQNNSKNSERGA